MLGVGLIVMPAACDFCFCFCRRQRREWRAEEAARSVSGDDIVGAE